MRTTVCMLTASLMVAVTHAGAPIEWSAGTALAQTDFRAKVPAAASDAAHSYVSLDVSWECRDGRVQWRSRAVFDPDQSWWRGSTSNIWGGIEQGFSRTQLDNRKTAADRDRDLLKHEQLHFDLTELAARSIRRQFEWSTRVCMATERIAEMEKSVAEIQQAWSGEQIRYDKETDHGVNQWKQREWEQRVTRSLGR